MNPKTSKMLLWIGGFFGGGILVTILGFAMQFWISINISSQIDLIPVVVVPDIAQLTTDVEVIKATVLAIDDKADKAIESQDRFEKTFTDYLINEANR